MGLFNATGLPRLTSSIACCPDIPLIYARARADTKLERLIPAEQKTRTESPRYTRLAAILARSFRSLVSGSGPSSIPQCISALHVIFVCQIYREIKLPAVPWLKQLRSRLKQSICDLEYHILTRDTLERFKSRVVGRSIPRLYCANLELRQCARTCCRIPSTGWSASG